MPNRIIKESIRTSYEVDILSAEAERTFYRLLTYADDYGRFLADPRILKSNLFPLKEKITVKIITSSFNELGVAGLITFYVVNGKPYGKFETWSSHQTIRNQKSKFPDPGEENYTTFVSLLKSIEINRKQLNTNVPVIQSNPIQSIRDMTNAKTAFDLARKEFLGDKRGLQTEFDYLVKILPNEFKEIIPLLLPAIKAQIEYKNELKSRKLFVPEWPHFKTWIYNRRWEDEFILPDPDTDNIITSEAASPSGEIAPREIDDLTDTALLSLGTTSQSAAEWVQMYRDGISVPDNFMQRLDKEKVRISDETEK